MAISLASLGLSAADLANTHVLFTVVTNNDNAAPGGTVCWIISASDPVPASRQGVLGFPFPRKHMGSCRSMQWLRTNTTPLISPAQRHSTYEIALIEPGPFWARGSSEDCNARLLANTLVMLAATTAMESRFPRTRRLRGFAQRYYSGDLALFQQPGRTKGSKAMSASRGLVRPFHPRALPFVLDRCDRGNNAIAMLSLLDAFDALSPISQYLAAARAIGLWIAAT